MTGRNQYHQVNHKLVEKIKDKSKALNKKHLASIFSLQIIILKTVTIDHQTESENFLYSMITKCCISLKS